MHELENSLLAAERLAERQAESELGAAALLTALAVALLWLAAGWRLFAKAGRPGWAALVPVYNALVFLDIAGLSRLWLPALFLPPLTMVVGLAALYALGRAFGRGHFFCAGLMFLPALFVPILAFGASPYGRGAGGRPRHGLDVPRPPRR